MFGIWSVKLKNGSINILGRRQQSTYDRVQQKKPFQGILGRRDAFPGMHLQEAVVNYKLSSGKRNILNLHEYLYEEGLLKKIKILKCP